MDKNAIKKYAVWARRELIARVTQKAEQYEITEKKTTPADADSIGGRVLTATEKKQRQTLIAKINQGGFEQVMEEVAYTWFNRFTALRFMEVNNHLPSHTRVFTNENGEFKPQILADAISLELEGLDMDMVFELKDANKTEELYKYLLITQCNALSGILPRMFQKIEDYTELLLPDYLLREGSVIEQMIALIPEEDWADQVQIIGWLYQYYNSEKKDEVFATLKKNVKITKENIPAATQLFTPDWIVHYMVENSLGRLWLEGHPSENLKSEWKYYLDEAEQEPEVEAQLAAIRKEYADLKPEEIKCIDPCSGSGHILCVLFDTLVRIYEEYGYTAREAATKIIENNLWGLDIDERAAQLSYFTVMMKARQYDRRFFTRKVQPHVYTIRETNVYGSVYKQSIRDFGLPKEYQESLEYLLNAFVDAKEYGSILQLEDRDYVGLKEAWNAVFSDADGNMNMTLWSAELAQEIPHLIDQAIALAQKYDAVVTNPPYMGSSGMNPRLSEYVKKNYPDSKSDLFAVFIEQCGKMAAKNRYQAMITQHAWMFLSSFEKLRSKILETDIVNMAHLGPRAFEEIGGEVVQTTSFVLRKSHVADYKGTYCRLIEPTTQQGKEDMFLAGENRYITQQSNFSKIPGNPVAYWVSENFTALFAGKTIRDIAFAGIGMRTGDNDRFLRFWHEIERNKMYCSCANAEEALRVHAKWIPYNKGGEFRRWYGNNEYVVNWENDGKEIKDNTRRVYPQLGDNLGWKISNEQYYFREGITWTVVSSKKTSFRRYYQGAIISNSGQSVISDNTELLDYLTGLLNTNIVADILAIISPTIGFESGYINKIPVIYNDSKSASIIKLTNCNINCSRDDWNSYEISWDFQRHPLLRTVSTIAEAFDQWKMECDNRFNQLKANEEELNHIFIDIYGLQKDLTPDVADRDITVHRIYDTKDDIPDSLRGSNYIRTKREEIVSLISYAVGCMFGRYSLDVPGLAYAGGDWNSSKYVTFQPDKDAIIPICDDEYFDDDIVGRFVKFVEAVYGKKTLEENLQFIADALGGKGQPRDVIRNYFLNDFYKDHCKTYQKRPIYWLFDGGKKNSFKCLIYMHRYQPDTIARIRTDYVHEQQSRYRTAIADLERQISSASTSERVKLNKQLVKLQAQAEEVRIYEEKIHHLADQYISIDLDDGVKHNYALFADVLAKIK